MRRILTVLIATSLLVVAGTEVANAAPVDPSQPAKTTLTKSVAAKGPGTATFAAVKSAQQDPPLGGCDFSDVSATATGTYVENALVSIQGSWHAQTICTTTAPGQSMGGITVNSQLWHNGNQGPTGVPFACTNCNLGNSPGSWADGPTGYGTYWVGATFFFALPAGWIWTAWPTACNPNASRTALTCVATSGTLYMPPTYNG